jgi:hypothetical protein
VKVTRFRVGVVTVMEVEVTSDDERDARRVAEGAIEYLVSLGNSGEDRSQPVIKWRHRNGADYEVTLVRRPIEVGAAARNGVFTVDVAQPQLKGYDDD